MCLVEVSTGSRPAVGLKPYTLQNPAGLRRDPIMSEPSAMGNSLADKAAAAPPLEPPADRRWS